jgi:hypothetical protein
MPEVANVALSTQNAPDETAIAMAMAKAEVRKGNAGKLRVIGEYRGKHVFRSHAGKLRGCTYTMDCLKPTWEEPDDDPAARRSARISLQYWERRNDEEQRETLAQALLDNQGSRKIKFKYVGTRTGHTGHVELETNSDAIAAVLNRAIASGDLQFIYYIDQSKYLKVGDKAFAANEVGQKLAMAESLSTNTGIEIIKKDV